MVETFGYVEPSLDDLFALLEHLSPQIAEHGTFNFCLSNGQALYTYATWIKGPRTEQKKFFTPLIEHWKNQFPMNQTLALRKIEK